MSRRARLKLGYTAGVRFLELSFLPALVVLCTGCSRSPGAPAPGVASPSAPGSAELASSAANSALLPATPAVATQTALPESAGSTSPSHSSTVPSGVLEASSAEPAPEAAHVTNIGMHIGGGPNDDATKAPIRRSVSPHFVEIGRCWRLVADQGRPGDFGLDLRIPRAGGKAEVSHPRTALKGAGFEQCVVDVFAAIDFEPPRGGDTVVSYSVRFTPTR